MTAAGPFLAFDTATTQAVAAVGISGFFLDMNMVGLLMLD